MEDSLMTDATPTHIQLPPIRYKIGEEVNSPSDGVNNHSTFRYVNMLKEILSDSLFSRLENTFLGPIIKAGSRKGGGTQKGGDGLGFSGQLLHFLLSRQIKTTREDEVWFHFDGQPMRFPLREFHLVTGLPCLETEEEAPIEHHFDWPLCNDATHTCDDLLAQIKALHEDAEEGKLRLAMLLLVESIFLLKYTRVKCKFPKAYVERAKNNMTSYPWGEDSFRILISSVNEVSNTALEKGKYNLKGFPMALHLWFLASVPNLEAAFSRLDSPSEFICARYLSTQLPSFHAVGVIEITKDAQVICVLGNFDDDANLYALVDKEDDDLATIVTLVNRGYRVAHIDWNRNFIDLGEAEEFISQKNM